MLFVIISEHKHKLKFLKSRHCSLLLLVLSLFNIQYFILFIIIIFLLLQEACRFNNQESNLCTLWYGAQSLNHWDTREVSNVGL